MANRGVGFAPERYSDPITSCLSSSSLSRFLGMAWTRFTRTNGVSGGSLHTFVPFAKGWRISRSRGDAERRRRAVRSMDSFLGTSALCERALGCVAHFRTRPLLTRFKGRRTGADICRPSKFGARRDAQIFSKKRVKNLLLGGSSMAGDRGLLSNSISCRSNALPLKGHVGQPPRLRVALRVRARR